MNVSPDQPGQVQPAPSGSSTVSAATQAPVPNIPDRLFESPLILPSRQQHDPRYVAEQPIFSGKKVFLVLSKNEAMPAPAVGVSLTSAQQALLVNQFPGANATTEPSSISRILVLAAFGREDLANVFVDDFIKHYTPKDEDEFVDRDAREHDRQQFLDKIKKKPMSVVDAYGKEVTSSNAPDAPEVYRVEDEEGRMLRFIWVDISWVEVPEGRPF